MTVSISMMKHIFTWQYGNVLLKELGIVFGRSKDGTFELKDYIVDVIPV